MVFLAPEAAEAAEAAGGAKRAQGAGAAAKRHRTGSAADHRAAIDKIKADRRAKGLPEGETQEEADAKAAANAPKPATAPAPAGPLRLTAMEPASTGSGVVLGTLAWVVFMNYLRGGMPQVRRWGAAKFLNKVTPTGGTK